MKKILFLFLIIFSKAQAQDLIDFNGKILSNEGFVYNANILNKAKLKGSVSDSQGNFSMMVNRGDVITFSSIGYKDLVFVIPDTLSTNNYRVLVQMIEDTVFLKESIVRPWPLKSEFSRAFLNEKQKESKNKIASFSGFKELDGDPKEPEPSVLNPISFVANLFNKKRIQKKKMEKFRKIIDQN